MVDDAGTCGAAVRPPRLLLALLGIGMAMDWALGRLGGLPGNRAASVILGALIVLAGAILLVSCMRRFARAGTHVATVKTTTALVTDGQYRWSRNPIYVALLAIYAGLTLVAGSPTSLLLGIAGALIIHFGVVLREERYLRAKFGASYDEYCGRTRRWL